MRKVATNGTMHCERKAPLSATEIEAVGTMRAREIALSESEVNARCHAIVAAARELNERVCLFLETTTYQDGAEVLKQAGLDDPESACRFGSNVFSEVIHQTGIFARKIDEYLSLVACDLPPLPRLKGGG